MDDSKLADIMGWSLQFMNRSPIGDGDGLAERVRRVAQAAADEARAERGQPVSCEWVQDDEGLDMWIAACGSNRYFTLDEGTPAENRMTFCCWCGGPLREVLA